MVYCTHECDLAIDDSGFSKLPPNAKCRVRFVRALRKLVLPDPKAAISKRSYRNHSQICAERRRHARSKFFYIIHPYSNMEKLRQFIFIIIGTHGTITTPLCIAFQKHWDKSTLNFYSSYVAISRPLFFALEFFWLVTNFFTGYTEKTPKNVQVNQWKIIKRYLKTYFIIDLLYTIWIPSILGILPEWFQYLKLAILLRLFTVGKCYKRFLLDFGLSAHLNQIIWLILVSLSMLHLLTCFFFMFPFFYYDKLGIIRENTWIYKGNLAFKANLTLTYFSCFVLVNVHMWGLGEHFVRPENPLDMFILTVIMIIGRLWSLFVMANLLQIQTTSSLSESKYEEYLTQLKTFIDQKNISSEFKSRLLIYYQYKYQYHYFNEKAIFFSLSQYLRQELQMFLARGLISKVYIFRYLPKATVAAIIAKSKKMVYTTNNIISTAREPIESVYFINSGIVAVLNANEVEITHLTDGEEVGLSAVTNTTKHKVTYAYTYIAVETTELYVISVKDFRNLMPAKPEIMKYLSNRVQEKYSTFAKIEIIATTQALDLLSELRSGKVLERPTVRTRYFDN
ncbi:potassium/sodium hyperpolarization-activated cyclic nucleotide-gated channel 2-like [Sitophilus oryzae]|uniref:Potassium/sodium hyperpolarization-activated cyclic nucleotide-gated channel 2-like n=1 Tax=Sitophilus oryzae TaxID=7048 RepID=A0A6J2YX57_SITOR|nr:potassium/sodium hyperpolarization-activated cyclic nucleotide-gated channel 2-like [Sitophilus oryzae]